MKTFGEKIYTVKELKEFMDSWDDEDLICIEGCDDDGEVTDLYPMAIDVIDGIELTDGKIVKEIRFCQRPNKPTSMEKLTLEDFNKLPHSEPFAKGALPNGPDGIFMTNANQSVMLKWIAKKGGGNDWAIYCHWARHSDQFVLDHGDKVNNEINIRKCVPCSDEVFNLYRY